MPSRTGDRGQEVLLSNSIVYERRVAVVTGGGRGLGAEYVRELARRGRGLMISVGLLAATAPSEAGECDGECDYRGGRPPCRLDR